MIKTTKFFLFLSVFVLSTVFYNTSAHTISISWKRVVFDENIKKDTLTISNDKDQEQTYDIDWTHYRMQGKNGSLKSIPNAKPVDNIKWADDMIKIDPPQLIIPAHAQKDITLSIIPSATTIAGEYRSHLRVRTNVTKNKIKTKNSITIQTATGVSTPIFVHYGKFTVKAAIEDIILRKKSLPNKYDVTFTLIRSGDRSIYGSIDIVCVMKDAEISLKRVHGISVYNEITQKRLTLNFEMTKAQQKECGQFKLHYRPRPEDKLFNNKIMASASVNPTDIVEE